MGIDTISSASSPSPTIAPPDVTAGGSQAVAGGATLLPEPVGALMASGDVGAEIAAMGVMTGQTEQQTDRQERDALEALQQQRENSEVQAMRDKAGQIIGQSIAQGAGMVAQGGMTVCSATASAQDVPGQNQPAVPGRVAGLTGDQWKAGGLVIGGIGQLTGGIYQAGAANDDANAAQYHAEAAHLASSAQDVHDDMRSAGDYVRSALDFYREYESTQAQIRNATIHIA
jgi:hypothetical protein